jgi:hypothetical protein
MARSGESESGGTKLRHSVVAAVSLSLFLEEFCKFCSVGYSMHRVRVLS